MKKLNRGQGVLVAMTSIIIFILSVLLGFFIRENNQTSEELENVQTDYVAITEKLNTTQNELLIVQENLQIEAERSIGLSEALENVNKNLEEANATIADLKNEKYELVYMGDFKITYYCDERYQHICGGNGVTASGKPTEVGFTAAADWGVLPKGSIIYIENIGFREIQDRGGAVNDKHIDVLVQKHQEALSLGTRYNGVWLLVKKNS